MKSQWIRIFFFIGEHGKGSTSSKFNTTIGRNQKLGIKLEEEKKKKKEKPSPLPLFLPFFPADTNLLLLRLLLVVDKEVSRKDKADSDGELHVRRRAVQRWRRMPVLRHFLLRFFFFFLHHN